MSDPLVVARSYTMVPLAETADWDALCAAILAVHPYDTPEIVRTPVEAGELIARYADA